jgi:Type VI secretion system/phage-baseplate injector OB domain
VFGHEVGDQVLLGHERGDPRRPYVLGGIVFDHSRHTVGGQPVRTEAAASSLVWRGMVSPSGNRLAFHDQIPPGAGAKPTASQIVLGTGTGDLALSIDRTAGTVALHCAPGTGTGKVTIDCGTAGSVEIRAGAGGNVTVDGGAQLNLKAQASVRIESSGPVEIKGNPIKLN